MLSTINVSHFPISNTPLPCQVSEVETQHNFQHLISSGLKTTWDRMYLPFNRREVFSEPVLESTVWYFYYWQSTGQHLQAGGVEEAHQTEQDRAKLLVSRLLSAPVMLLDLAYLALRQLCYRSGSSSSAFCPTFLKHKLSHSLGYPILCRL